MLKKGQQLPDEHHILRRVPWSRLLKDGDDNVIGFFPDAFKLRDGEPDLSVSWVEHHQGPTHEERVAQCIVELRKANIRKTKKKLGTKTGFGIAVVGRVKEVCARAPKQIRIVYTPGDIGSHSSIENLPRDDERLREALATEAFAERVMNVDIPGYDLP